MAKIKVYYVCYGAYGMYFRVDGFLADDNKVSELYLKSEVDRYIAYLKYKRCLAMAKWCDLVVTTMLTKYDFEPVRECRVFYAHRALWWSKWKNRWLKLADKFKESMK